MKIAIITGGISSEREIAIRSSKLFIDHLPGADCYIFPDDLEQFLPKYKTYDLVIPVFHGIYGEDGQIFAFLATLGLPTTFSPWQVHAIAIDKHMTDCLVRQAGFLVPSEVLVRRNAKIPSFSEKRLEFPLVVKPNRWGSTIATEVVNESKELQEAIAKIHFEERDDALVQECILGREFTVSLLGNNQVEVLWIAEIRNKDVIFNFEEKYNGPADFEDYASDIPQELRAKLESESKAVYSLLSCQGIARIDWRCDASGVPYFLEVNTIPGLTEVSLLPKAAKLAGYSEKQLVDKIVTLAMEVN
jgi:D-alanine-D-alanine ligase